MSRKVERTIRVVDPDEPQSRPAEYWRTRPFVERLAEVLALHREGNRLFKSGHPPFVFEMKARHVERA